jgi:hypothetical protein
MPLLIIAKNIESGRQWGPAKQKKGGSTMSDFISTNSGQSQHAGLAQDDSCDMRDSKSMANSFSTNTGQSQSAGAAQADSGDMSDIESIVKSLKNIIKELLTLINDKIAKKSDNSGSQGQKPDLGTDIIGKTASGQKGVEESGNTDQNGESTASAKAGVVVELNFNNADTGQTDNEEGAGPDGTKGKSGKESGPLSKGECDFFENGNDTKNTTKDNSGSNQINQPGDANEEVGRSGDTDQNGESTARAKADAVVNLIFGDSGTDNTDNEKGANPDGPVGTKGKSTGESGPLSKEQSDAFDLGGDTKNTTKDNSGSNQINQPGDANEEVGRSGDTDQNGESSASAKADVVVNLIFGDSGADNTDNEKGANPDGTSGFGGPSGPDGTSGFGGPSGPDGPSGPVGTKGKSTGESGPSSKEQSDASDLGGDTKNTTKDNSGPGQINQPGDVYNEVDIDDESKGGWGDPHFDLVGADGEEIDFDHKGVDHHTYHLFSGDNIRIEGEYVPTDSQDDPQVIGSTTAFLGNDVLTFTKDGDAALNGEALENGSHMLEDGTEVVKDDDNLSIIPNDGSGVVDIAAEGKDMTIDPSGKFQNLDGIIGKSIGESRPLSKEECDAFDLTAKG